MNKLQIQAAAELRLRKIRAKRLSEFNTQREFYQKNPLQWISDRLGVSKETILWSLNPGYENHKWDGTPDPLYKILLCLSEGIRRIGVESATGTGKTFLAACIVLWFLECFEGSLVVTSAPKQDQLSLHIWKEIGKLHSRFNRGDLTTLKLRMNPGRDDWIAVGFVAGVKADEESSTKAQGFHARHLLIILEETPGIPKPIITAFENTAGAPHNIILALGNPDHQFDNLHLFCTQQDVEHIVISAFDHPNVVLDDPFHVPGAQSRYGIDDLKKKYGGDESPMFMSRARGITPKQAEDALIKMDWCIKCKDLIKNDEKNEEMKKGDPALGVDVANSVDGDKAAIAEGIGQVLEKVDDFHCPDANQLGKRDVKLKIDEKKIDPKRVGVDGVGVGVGTVNALKELDIEVRNLIGGSSPIDLDDDEQKFNNLRTQMWWQMREDIRHGNVILPNDPELLADLCTPKFKVKDKYIILESKEEIKKRLGRSPNKGDAAVYWNWVRIDREGPNIEFLTWGGK